MLEKKKSRFCFRKIIMKNELNFDIVKNTRHPTELTPRNYPLMLCNLKSNDGFDPLKYDRVCRCLRDCFAQTIFPVH